MIDSVSYFGGYKRNCESRNAGCGVIAIGKERHLSHDVSDQRTLKFEQRWIRYEAGELWTIRSWIRSSVIWRAVNLKKMRTNERKQSHVLRTQILKYLIDIEQSVGSWRSLSSYLLEITLFPIPTFVRFFFAAIAFNAINHSVYTWSQYKFIW